VPEAGPTPRVVNILAISGSLRAASLNSLLLRAAARVAPAGVELRLFDGLGELPLFNPDIGGEPEPVARLHAAINVADAMLIASPEYAHGVTGVIKNALDWMVGNESFVGKPVALFNASPRATHAQAALRETVLTMSARVVEGGCITVPVLGSGLDENGLLAHPVIAPALRTALESLRQAVTVAETPAGAGAFQLDLP
jgi:chromate reductase, NAD(P)H dehydrogenase (quinone)